MANQKLFKSKKEIVISLAIVVAFIVFFWSMDEQLNWFRLLKLIYLVYFLLSSIWLLFSTYELLISFIMGTSSLLSSILKQHFKKVLPIYFIFLIPLLFLPHRTVLIMGLTSILFTVFAILLDLGRRVFLKISGKKMKSYFDEE